MLFGYWHDSDEPFWHLLYLSAFSSGKTRLCDMLSDHTGEFFCFQTKDKSDCEFGGDIRRKWIRKSGTLHLPAASASGIIMPNGECSYGNDYSRIQPLTDRIN